MDESVTKQFEGQFELQRITKLSQAIRIGARIRPQCFGTAFQNGRSCAWGAAWEGTGRPYIEGMNYQDSMYLHEWHGVNKILWDKLDISISVMNDSGMTREAIADKLEAMGF